MAEDVVLLTTFTNGSKKIRVVFHNNILVWDYERPPFEQKTLNLENMLSVKPNYLKCSHPSQDPQIDPFSFTIHYGVRETLGKWKYKALHLKHSDPLQVVSWIKTLEKQISGLVHRPKSLLIFINPFGGKRNSMDIYTKFGKPLFEIAGVDVTVNVSQRKDQIRDFLINGSLDMFDSVACVGGDGTVSELFNGLVLRECRLKNIDADNINTPLPSPQIPVGIIPGGSTDTITYCLHGTTDPTTAVFHIIFGDSVGLDLVSVYNENNLLKLFASVLSYGYLGDVAYNSDRHRWMGPQRYNYSGLKKLLANKGYRGEVALLTNTESNDISRTKCFENCDTCGKDGNEEVVKSQWRTVSGKFFMVSGANISCACSQSPNGIAPYSHLGDGNMHLVLVKHGSIIDNLRLLLNLSNKKKHIEELPFVETYCVREFCFRSRGSSSRWNCDGEVQHQTNIRARFVHTSQVVDFVFTI
ncbi:hypothetical protein WA026_008894 [Henosepilachna vigintioctopunctata]|uniref:DAGKc domain-containing protein n=1 Tax=Henosepilachna vigintioctopunctata TaxID=420089 RepID=A0AAW1VDM4_9CUCU